jgi:hypothetical protein
MTTLLHHIIARAIQHKSLYLQENYLGDALHPHGRDRRMSDLSG